MATISTVKLGGTTQSNVKIINDNFTELNNVKLEEADVKTVVADEIKNLGYDADGDGVVDEAEKVSKSLTIQAAGGSTEGTNKWTFNGSAAKTINIAAGSNVTVTGSSNKITIAAVDTITTLASTATAASVTLTTTAKSGAVILGNAATKIVSTTIPESPTTAQAATLPTLSAVKTYADNLLAANDAMVFKGVVGTGTGMISLPTTNYRTGWTYKVGTAGTYAGQTCEVGDTILCIKTYDSAFSNSDFTVIQANVDGAVTSAETGTVTKNTVPIYSDTTGTHLKSSGFTIGVSVPANAKFTDTVYSIVKHDFTATSSEWSSTANADGEFTLTFTVASGRQPVAVYRNDNNVYRLAMAGIGVSGTTVTVQSYDKFAGYVICV